METCGAGAGDQGPLWTKHFLLCPSFFICKGIGLPSDSQTVVPEAHSHLCVGLQPLECLSSWGVKFIQDSLGDPLFLHEIIFVAQNAKFTCLLITVIIVDIS